MDPSYGYSRREKEKKREDNNWAREIKTSKQARSCFSIFCSLFVATAVVRDKQKLPSFIK